jgi:hypothetical protein
VSEDGTVAIATERRFTLSNEPRYSYCIISSNDTTTSRVILGDSVSGLNRGISTVAQGLLLPAVPQTTLPALTATVYFKDENGHVTVVSPTPPILWELSCGANLATIDQNGVITRQSNPNASSFDSNGMVSTGQIGSLVQVSATVLRADGSKSGVVGLLNIAIQNSAARQGAAWAPEVRNGFRDLPAIANNSPSGARGFYDLVNPPTNYE